MSDSSYCPKCASELPASSNFCERCDEEVKPLSSVHVTKYVFDGKEVLTIGEEPDDLSGWFTFLFSLISWVFGHLVVSVVVTIMLTFSGRKYPEDYPAVLPVGIGLILGLLMIWVLWKPNRWLSKLISRNIKRLFRNIKRLFKRG
tara:strand:- start:83 stop:517 length:435 start_codon:yes stop_codon:yes gene_type:complete